jgi:hypothetical protein
MSCAIACMGMVEDQIEMQCHEGEPRIKRLSGAFPRSLLASQLNGDNNGLGWGTWADNVARTLPSMGIRVSLTETFTPGPGNYGFQWRKPRIRTGFPAIILVGWYRHVSGRLRRNGGHFIVAARTTSRGYVVVLDPANGTMHELRGSQGRYNNHGLNGLMEVMIYTG